MLKKYKLGFDIGAFGLFLAIMIPNFYWCCVEAPHDVLRNESMTPVIDMVASIFPVIMVVALCLIQRKEVGRRGVTAKTVGMLVCYIIYVIAWILYYQGDTGAVVIVLLCVAPCVTFGFYAIDRKKYLALLPLGVFGVCHLVFGVVNFII